MQFVIYTAVWISACAMAVAIVARDPRAFAFCRPAYWSFLLQSWKVATFAVALAGLVVMAPYTGDPTWDAFDATGMGVLTYLTAPWSVGTLGRSIRGKADVKQSYVAACTWMLSASWCYDAYLWIRDGSYPLTWLANIGASSVLYCSAGLLWNLTWRDGRGTTFAFVEDDWPRQNGGEFARIEWAALPFMILVACLLGTFLVSP